MRITLEQYPGFVQNIETIASVDLADTDLMTLTQLEYQLRMALGNVARTIAALTVEEARAYEREHGEPPF